MSMTAVAPPPNFQNLSRQGWSVSNGVGAAATGPNGATQMGSDDYRQMFMPRKSVQRSNSSSSLNSNASSSTVIASSAQTNGVGPASAGDASTWAARKKGSRGLWPTSKTEPVSGISTARPQSIASASSGPSATTAMSALHTPAPMVPSQQNGAVQSVQNGPGRAQSQENSAILHLTPMNGTFDRKTITVPFFPDVLRIGRQTNNKTIPTPMNGFFDSKVLSRQHAEIWADRTGKIWIRDVKSSNGTFVNGQRLSPENRDSDPHELKKGDMLELGIDIVSEDQKTIVHHKVAAHVEHAGIYPTAGANLMDLNFGDMDNVQMQNLVGAGGQQQVPNMRGRNLSQGSINAARMQAGGAPLVSGAGSMPLPRHWLQPITMEQVVKKLNAEIKAARQQSQDLQQTQHYITAMLTAEPKKENNKHSVRFSPVKDIKNRFSEPPAPPPQQPLPEKPDGPSLRRSDTERPVGSGSPSRTNSRIASLAEELSSARKEIEAQSLRVRDLEALLSEERRAREDAEERANRLERESFKDRQQPADKNADEELTASTSTLRPDEVEQTKDGASSPNIVDLATSRLQHRLETMMAEMNEMKQQMEIYRKRAEDAEADSAVQRKSLAEMIEKIRQEDAKKAARVAQRKARSEGEGDSASRALAEDEGEEWEDTEEGEIPIMNGKDLDIESPGGLLQRVGLQHGRTEHQDATEALAKGANQLATRQPSHHDLVLTHGAPAVSILTVVALGVAVMAWLNSYPKVER